MALQLPLPKERSLQLASQVDQASINSLTKSIIEINDDDEYLTKLAELNGFTYNPKPIIMRIDSYGGYLYQCYGLLSVMEKSKIPVHTIVTGCAMSCGFMIAITGHKRFAYDKSTFMYHQLSSGEIGKLKEMEEAVMEGKRLQKILESHVIEKTKLTQEDLKKNYDKKKDWFINSKKALKLGIIDQII
jgi:ATP-dependent Clp protease protease subunit